MKKSSILIGQILFLVVIIFVNICARMVLSPLLVKVEQDLGVTHAEAGRFFLIISITFSLTMLLSGFVSQKIQHRGTLLLSIAVIASSTLLIALSSSLFVFKIGLVFIGVGAGLYGPSGLATITTLADSEHWGKAYSLHELGPGIAFVMAPVVAEIGLRIGTWRTSFIILSVLNMVIFILFALLGKGGREKGEPPHFENLKQVFALPSFWILTIFFMIVSGYRMGVYSMLPTFLVVERSLDHSFVNILISVSRISGLVVIIISGMMVDRFGEKVVIGWISAVTGTLTLLIGIAKGPYLIIMVILQPMLVDAFFPAALSAIAKVGPNRIHNVSISLIVPLGYFFGAGVVPAFMGYLADIRHFPLGFIVLGAMVFAAMPFLRRLR